MARAVGVPRQGTGGIGHRLTRPRPSGDDIGYSDLGARNGGKTLTPALDALIADGITLSSYYTFKICSPSRAASLTGRYPFGAGFYDMSFDGDHRLRISRYP